MRSIGIIFLSFALAGAAVASAYKDFSKVWEQRETTYRGERPGLEARAKSSADAAVKALILNDPNGPQDLGLALAAAWSLSELVGRGQTLWALREHMAGRPSVQLSEAWLQGKIDELQRKEAEADMIAEQMQMLKARDDVSVQQWIAALEQLSMMRGSISGAAAELTLIQQNLESYYSARAGETIQKRALIGSVLSALAATSQRKQLEFERRVALCATTGLCR